MHKSKYKTGVWVYVRVCVGSQMVLVYPNAPVNDTCIQHVYSLALYLPFMLISIDRIATEYLLILITCNDG